MRVWLALACLCIGCGGNTLMRPEPEPTGGRSAMPDLAVDERCGPYTAETLMKCVQRAHIERDVRTIAKPRPPSSGHHAAVQRMCAKQLGDAGYEVSLQAYGTGTNVVGIKPGFSKDKEHVVVSAHYDHLDGCAGADDNASGVAAVLETARVLSTARFDRSLVIACWDEAERGQVGSAAYAQEAVKRGDKIVAMWSYEALGYASSEPDSQTIPERFDELFPDQALAMQENENRGNFLMVVAETSTEPWAQAVQRRGKTIELPVYVLTLTEAVKARQQSLHRSDHASFWDAKFPALLLTDSGSFRNPNAHCKAGADAVESLDFDFASRATAAGLGAVVDVLQLR